jgi:hypothetical protein
MVWKFHSARSRQKLLKRGLNRGAKINGWKGMSGSPARAVQSASQAGDNLISELRFCAAITDAREWPALFRKLFQSLLYLAEIRMWFYGHDLSAHICALLGRHFQCNWGGDEMQLWLRYYASDEERAKHAKEYPKDTIPPKEKPSCNRDWRLPKGPF